MIRRKIVAGNWKMNLTQSEAAKLAAEVCKDGVHYPCQVILIPSFPYLAGVKQALTGSTVQIGAQNCSSKENGALTGEVSAAQLQSVGIEFVIIGHSERREQFGESNAVLKDKLTLALKYRLKPIFCCGEPLKVRERGNEQQYVEQQLEESLFPFSQAELEQLVIAYEPIWAIGTGLNATAEQAQQMHVFIRGLVQGKYGSSAAQQLHILYGGSCKPSNAKELFSCPDVDGGLIGGASLVAKDFLAIIAAAQ